MAFTDETDDDAQLPETPEEFVLPPAVMLHEATLQQLFDALGRKTKGYVLAYINPGPNDDYDVHATIWHGNAITALGLAHVVADEITRMMNG